MGEDKSLGISSIQLVQPHTYLIQSQPFKLFCKLKFISKIKSVEMDSVVVKFLKLSIFKAII